MLWTPLMVLNLEDTGFDVDVENYSPSLLSNEHFNPMPCCFPRLRVQRRKQVSVWVDRKKKKTFSLKQPKTQNILWACDLLVFLKRFSSRDWRCASKPQAFKAQPKLSPGPWKWDLWGSQLIAGPHWSQSQILHCKSHGVPTPQAIQKIWRTVKGIAWAFVKRGHLAEDTPTGSVISPHQRENSHFGAVMSQFLLSPLINSGIL